MWDRATGEPICNAIVWQDRRTTDVCDALVRSGAGPNVRAKTGLPIDPYFSATKIAWILDNVDGARAKAEAGLLAFGTVDTWFLWQLTEGCRARDRRDERVADAAVRHRRGAWDAELCQLFGVPMALLPDVVASSAVVGTTAEGIFETPVAIGSMVGDQQAALVGNGGFEAGDAKATFGTGIFALMHTGSRARGHRRARLHGRGLLAGRRSSTRSRARSSWAAPSCSGSSRGSSSPTPPPRPKRSPRASLTPAAWCSCPRSPGSARPNWDPLARGSIFGLTRGATDAHVARAAMEAIPLQLGDLMAAMREASGKELHSLRADGGVTVNTLVMQTLADVLGIDVEAAEMAESTALGAAYLAGRAVGVWARPEDLPMLRGVARTYQPDPDAEARLADLRWRWAEAVKRSLNWERG